MTRDTTSGQTGNVKTRVHAEMLPGPRTRHVETPRQRHRRRGQHLRPRRLSPSAFLLLTHTDTMSNPRVIYDAAGR